MRLQYIQCLGCYIVRAACCEYFQHNTTCPTDAPKVTTEYAAAAAHIHMYYCCKTSSSTWMLRYFHQNIPVLLYATALMEYTAAIVVNLTLKHINISYL